MASTPEGRRLTEAHRQAQQQVRDDFLAEFIALWVLLDSARLDETGPGWIRAVMRVLRQYRRLSAAIAVEYFWEFRVVELPSSETRPRVPDTTARPGGPVSPPAGPNTGRPPRVDDTPSRPRRDGFQGWRPDGDVIPSPRNARSTFDVLDELIAEQGDDLPGFELDIPDLDWDEMDRAAEVSLIVTGPVSQKRKAKRDKWLELARGESFVESSGAASRHVLTGGRQSLLTLVREDTRAIGWVRVTDGDPCAFCAMLASRGPVYKQNSFSRSDPRWTGPGTVKVHDACACTLEAVYSRESLWPGRAAEFRRLWRQHIEKRYSGADARREWRRVYERLQREARREQIA